MAPRPQQRVSGKSATCLNATLTDGTSRAPSKKGQANELSKGALRALRAQARQGGSGENSDMSRSVSRAASPDVVKDDFDDLDDFDSPAPSMMYIQEHAGQPTLVPDQSYSQPTMSWGYQQPADPGPSYDQGYAFTGQRQQYQREYHSEYRDYR
jgi:hypothetical protein